MGELNMDKNKINRVEKHNMAEAPLPNSLKDDLDEEERRSRLEDLSFFKRILTQDPIKGRMVVRLCRLLNKLAPITVSGMFHDMSCCGLYNYHSNGKYWSKASLFVVANTQIGKFVWDQMQKEELQSDTCVQEVTHPLLSKELCDKFKDNFKVSDADREYAYCGFNNCVHPQLPIYPSMMYQWWLSSSYYLLKLETLLADFYHLKFPQHMQKTVQSLVSVVERARFYLNLGLQCLFSNKMDDVLFKIQQYEDIISAVSVVLHYFCQSGAASTEIDAIKCLKRMCWSESSAREVTISPGLQKQRDLKEHFEPKCEHEFVLPLWDNLPASVFMREQLVACTGCTSCKATIKSQKIKDFKDAKKMNPDLSLDTLKHFICKALLEKGRFLVGDQEALLRVADDPKIWKFFYKWVRNKGSETPLDEADRGPFYDVLVLTVELEQANLEAAITQRLTTLSGVKSLAVDQCEDPAMTLEEIEECLLRDIELEPPWTFAAALKESQAQVARVNEISQYFLQHGNSTAFFQYIIQNMVLRVAENCYDPEKKEGCIEDEHQDLRFIQYLLPCFVASYFDLREDKRVSLKARNFYLNFIKNLLTLWDHDICKGVYFKEETVCFLKWKFETVSRDLEGFLYNELTEEGQPLFITSTMKSNCFDVLTDFLGKTEDHTSFQHWKEELYLFARSLQGSLLNLVQKPPGFSWKWGAELRAMSTLSRVLAAEVFKRYGFKDKTEYNQTNLLLGAIFKSYGKSEKLMKLKMMPGVTKKDTWSDFQTKVETESTKLSELQQVALALYMCLSSTGVKNIKVDETHLFHLRACTDAVERAYYLIKSGKHLKVQQTLSSWQRDEKGVNLAQVSYKHAMKVAPLCYSVVSCRLTKDLKIQMKEPGEITFCPVRHCRWCGQVETEQKELFICQFCKDIPEYPDINLFCTLDCEEMALDKKHRQEHAEIEEVQYGIRDVEHYLDDLSHFFQHHGLEQLEPNYFIDKDLKHNEPNTHERDKDLEELKPNEVADSIKKDKDLSEIETDVFLEDKVGSQICSMCLKKEPKEYVLCKGRCKGRFHLQCAHVLDSEGILKDDFIAGAWRCDKCSIPPGAAVNNNLLQEGLQFLTI